jgi:hypothetical protein
MILQIPWVISEIKSVLNYEGIYPLLRGLTDLPIYYRIMPNNVTKAIVYNDIMCINGTYTYKIDYVYLSRQEIDT